MTAHRPHRRPALVALLVLTTLTAGSACRRRQTAPPAAPAPAAESEAERARREALEEEARRRAADEAAARERAEREAAAAAGARGGARAVLEAPVYFSFDRAELEAEAREALEAKLTILRQNPGVRIRITGHTDDRGSDEYNLALGQRRAAAAKRFLVQRDVDAERIEIASVGEEQPVCTEEAERCWARNRRAEFAVTAGTVADGGRAGGRAGAGR